MDKSLRLALIIGGIVIAVLVIVPMIVGQFVGLQGYDYGYGMMGPGMMGGFGGMWFMPIIMVIFWGLVIWGIVALARGVSYSNGGVSGQSDSPIEVLKRRYAHGEINKEEFEQKKKDLA